MPLHKHLDSRITASISAIESLRTHLDQLTALIAEVLAALDSGNTIYTCGNGGSSAQAMHLSEELIGRYRTNRPAQRAICLNADPTALTCIANDFGFENVFSRQCEALIREGDVLIAFSTSGKSPNILNAFKTARQRGGVNIGLLGTIITSMAGDTGGGLGGPARDLCNHAIVVAGPDTAIIQDAHQVLLHLICEAVEHHLTAASQAGQRSSTL